MVTQHQSQCQQHGPLSEPALTVTCPLLRQTCSLDDLMVYNDVAKDLIKVCGQRGDSHEEESSRITGAVTDLCAADAQYHQTCFTSLVSSRNISAAVKSTSKQKKSDPVNLAFSCVIFNACKSNQYTVEGFDFAEINDMLCFLVTS